MLLSHSSSSIMIVGLMLPAVFALGDEPGFSRVDVYVGGRDGYHTYRIPSLVVTTQGTVLAFCEGRKNSARDYGDIDLLLKRSTDNGRTWSEQIIVHEEGGDAEITIGNPCPIVDRKGIIHLLFTRNNQRLFYTCSTDDGRTWAEPREHTSILKDLSYPLARVASGPGHGIQTSRGRLIAPIWVCDRQLPDVKKEPTPSRYQSGVIYSDDAGRTWQTGKLVPPVLDRLNEGTVFERVDGTLSLNLRGYQLGFRAVSQSTDAGRTWSEPVLDKELICPTCQASILRLSPREVIFSNPASTARTHLTIRFSDDEGRTWAHARVLDPGPSGYSDLALTRDGDILCLHESGQQFYAEKITMARFNRAWMLRDDTHDPQPPDSDRTTEGAKSRGN